MKMKKKILSVAVLAAIGSGTAQAVNLSQDGTGQVILFPYYTVQGNEETYLQVINTTDMGKAVKIRFREAYNSREVLDFNIYLSPYDVWTGTVTDAPGGGAGIRTYDNTCTVPDLHDEVVPFRTLRYQGDWYDGGPEGYERTREGYVEIIEMATLNPESTDPLLNDDGNGPADFVHNGDGVPIRCETFIENWDENLSNRWLPETGGDPTAPVDDITPPSGGLMGTLSIINVSTGTQVSVNATAIEAVYNTVQHHGTGSDLPNLAVGVDTTSVVMLNDGGLGQGAQVYETDWIGSANGLDEANAVSATLMASSIMNAYSFNPENQAESAWVVTFPTKWIYNGSEPFTKAFYGDACEEIIYSVYDREEQQPGEEPGEGPDFSPRPPGAEPEKDYLCYEVNVLQFGERSFVFSAINTKVNVLGLPGNKGWVNMMFPFNRLTAPDESVYEGLPVIGFKAKVLGNGQLPGAGSYASAVDHAYTRVISNAVPAYSQSFVSGAE